MLLTGRCTVKPDATLHLQTPTLATLAGTERNSDPEGAVDQFTLSQPFALSVAHEGLTVLLHFHSDLIQNPLLKIHTIIGVDYIAAQVTGEVEAFDSGDTSAYWETRNRFNAALFYVVNRVVDYFRYKLGNPFLKPVNLGHQTAWTWHDQDGKELYKDEGFLLAHHFPGLPGTQTALDSHALKPSQVDDLANFVRGAGTISVVDQLRASAKDAIFEGDHLLGVLQLAVAAEVAVKTAYFRRDPIVAEAYDFLEDKRHVEVSPIELVNQVAKRAFGERFSDHDANANQSLTYLFRCRNKVAHRGLAQYRDKDERLQVVDEVTIKNWWAAVTKLLTWLDAKTNTRTAQPE